MSKFKVGDKVKYIGLEHDINSQWFPIVGTIGTVVKDVDEVNCYIQWPKGSTSKEDCWYCSNNDIELVKNEDMTNEEIWEMLKLKMEKNGLKEYQGGLLLGGRMVPGYHVYLKRQVNEAISIAYRSGYERAMKGRPFKIGEKKKGGHWEPVDPNNLPKEGTKVRYSRECKECPQNNFIKLGQEGFVDYLGKELGIFYYDCKVQSLYWINFYNIEKYLDMWVEDNE